MSFVEFVRPKNMTCFKVDLYAQNNNTPYKRQNLLIRFKTNFTYSSDNFSVYVFENLCIYTYIPIGVYVFKQKKDSRYLK